MTITGPAGKATLQNRKNEWGEYVVRFYNADGARNMLADYYTDYYRDALATAKSMVENGRPNFNEQ